MGENSSPVAYVRGGLALIPIPLGKKGPLTRGWDLEARAVRSETEAAKLIGGNLGLAHRWCGTCALDSDDMQLAIPWLAARGFDLQTHLDAVDAVQITSGRPNRSKLVYRLPEGVKWLSTHALAAAGIELRCANFDGSKTMQDVLPPSTHPDTGKAYKWAGAGDWRTIPILPPSLLAIWQTFERRGVNDAGLNNDDLTGGITRPPTLYTKAQAKEYAEMLACIPVTTYDYDGWLRVGMALQWWDKRALWLWDRWSKGSPKYNEHTTYKKWASFPGRAGKITIGTLAHLAKKHGWTNGIPATSTLASFSDLESGRRLPPLPYVRTQDGRLGTIIDGQLEIWCDYDIYPIRRLYDIGTETAIVELRCHKRADGIMNFVLPWELLGDPKAFGKWLTKHGLVIYAKKVERMRAYLLDYMHDLEAHERHIYQYSQLGWKDEYTAFVLGHSVHRADGVSVDNSANGAVATIRGFAKRGDLNTWRRVMSLYERSGMEPYQFAIGIAFAAPLMAFSGYEGAVVAMVSPEGGQGKTTALHAINSVWGDPKDIGLQANDTQNAVLKRIGAYNNMPVTLDEVSNATGQQLSDLAYQITQGRERRRLNSDASEKQTLERWSTILALTANQSLLARLALYKTNSDAEVHRILEYIVQNPMTVSKEEAEAHFPLLFDHYGLAGDIYAKWLVQNVTTIKAGLAITRQKIDAAAGISTKERYWSAVSAAIITGVSAAKRLGLVGFDVQRLFNWTLGTIAAMRAKGVDITRDTVSILGAYLNQFMGNRIVVKKTASGSWIVLVDLKGTELVYRVEEDTSRIYLDRSHFRTWLARSGGDYHSLLMDLRTSGILTRANGKRSLGEGTNYTTAVTTCLEIDSTHPKLSAQPVLKIVGNEYTNRDGGTFN